MTIPHKGQLIHYVQGAYACPDEELADHLSRYDPLIGSFSSFFHEAVPACIVRAPGRVNLIGEHTDYNGYPVLPMAIHRDFVLVVSPSPDERVEVVNRDPSYEPRSFRAHLPVEPFPQGDWGNYIKAAVNGILEAGVTDGRRVIGFQAVVDGTIPESAGLSSSSALVVASALAFLAVNRVDVQPQELAELLARAERYVGSEGGGMDQAVSLLAQVHTALKIDFFPLRVEAIRLIDELLFVICNSLVRAPKSEHTRDAYNRRVVECRLAMALLSKAVGVKRGRAVEATRLADLAPEKLGMTDQELAVIAAGAIPPTPLSLREIAARLDEPLEEVRREYCSLKSGGFLAEPKEGFHVWKRYRHVVSEARRVEEAADAIRHGDTKGLGDLMDRSHASCRDDYEISCPELEALVTIGRRHGAFGARLTGAGFGGCTVNAVQRSQVGAFVRGVAEEYYNGYLARSKGRGFIEAWNLDDVVFACRPSAGASIFSFMPLSR